MIRALAPWSIARSSGALRRALLLMMIGTLLYGFGLHAARACMPPAVEVHHVAADGASPPCHDESDVAQAACDSHCRTDVQSGRTSFAADLPAVLVADLFASIAPVDASVAVGPQRPSSHRASGPPLHLLFHRLLR